MKPNKNIADLLIITSYPEKGKIHGVGTVGVASYTKNTLISILETARKEKKELKIVVLAERLNCDSFAPWEECMRTPSEVSLRQDYKEGGLAVRRIWQRGNLLLFFTLLKEILRFSCTRKVLFEFEMAMFGEYYYLLFLPLFLFILKISGREVILVPHQVIVDINEMSGHIGLEHGSIRADLINLLISVFYRSTFHFVDKIIVFEKYFKDVLSEFTKREKIVIIPHGVEEVKRNIAYEVARKRLGIRDELVLLYFGFIAWYKGTEWIIDKIRNPKSEIRNKKIKLIIAGGANPNHLDKQYYLNYIEEVEKVVKSSNGQIVMTGFIDEKNIPLYFQASDLVVLPYRTFMSSSGPLSLALSYKKPFLVSSQMRKIFDTPDFNKSLEKFHLRGDDLIFNFENDSLLKRISKMSHLLHSSSSNRHAELVSASPLSFNKTLKRVQGDKKRGNNFAIKLEQFIMEIREKRSFVKIGKMYYKEIFA